MKTLRLATRASPLALAQTTQVAALLGAAHPGLKVVRRVIRSEGDRRRNVALTRSGGRGLFTKELEEALLAGRADAAVHSLKDLPTAGPAGLAVAAVLPREDWRDAWISDACDSPWALPDGARVGTGSPRRRAQLAQRHPGLAFRELRGNVGTRLRKISQGDEVVGAVLALAGLRRLGLEARARRILGEDEMLPAPGQGFIVVQAAPDSEAWGLCRALADAEAASLAGCERAFLGRLQAGCLAPVGALARRDGPRVRLRAFVGLAPGRAWVREAEGPLEQAEALGRRLAETALAEGAEGARGAWGGQGA